MLTNPQSIIARNDGQPTPINQVPILSALEFQHFIGSITRRSDCFIAAYFAKPTLFASLQLFILIIDESNRVIHITSHLCQSNTDTPSLTSITPAIGVFEREIAEIYGVKFTNHPWLKPLRYPFNRTNQNTTIHSYPFYHIQSAELHEVNVGPVHAGIIEPGAFRFICEGEKIFHLEITLGYQHRGVEHQILATKNNLRRMCLAEQIAGDTTIGHTTAMAMIMEGGVHHPIIDTERNVALEMERIAMHIADTGALSMDAAYQLGQTSCEALRTIVINTMQLWCGNRFGRTLIRPHGTDFHLTLDLIDTIKDNLTAVVKRYKTVTHNLFSTPTILARMDEICTVTTSIATTYGAIGMAARSCGIPHDARQLSPTTTDYTFTPITESNGDIAARLRLRSQEVIQSYNLILTYLKTLAGGWFEKTPTPDFQLSLQPNSLYFSLVEGWRGTICHIATTDNHNDFDSYKIYDPSLRNWPMLAMSVRGAEISDFPLSNKSFNLSYAGHDL